MKKYLYQFATVCSSFALFIAIVANGAKSGCIYYQPEIPKGLEKFKKN